MAGIKSLVKDTAVYGLSSIVGRFLNWCLVPLYSYLFASSQYGIVTYLYSLTAVGLVILNYGMETGFFRYANKEGDPPRVYRTALASTATTSLLFILLVSVFLNPISSAVKLANCRLFVWLMGVTVALDAFSNIPFAWLRFSNRPWRFATIKMTNVGLNIGLNLFFLLACPWLEQHHPATIGWFYNPLGGDAFGIGWIFLANFISTIVVLLMLLPELKGASKGRFDSELLKRMVRYSWPLLVLGIAGIMSQNMGQLMIPYLFAGHEEEAREMVGIYGANIKIAIIMVMFAQAFRYAYEPFIFARARGQGEDNRQAYADAMKFFVIFGLFIFLGVMFFLPVLRHFISPHYWSGLRVVPVMMAAELCFGVYFNLSLWYKLTDRTNWGMYLSLICFALMALLNWILVPAIGIPEGYMGSAWAALASYAVVMGISWALGRKHYPIPYHMGRLALYALAALLLWICGEALPYTLSPWLLYPLRAILLLAYLAMVVAAEPKLRRML